MPQCPNGTQVKPSVSLDPIWVTAGDICDAVSWAATWMRPVCDQLVPRMIDIVETCASEPPPIPTIDLVAMAQAGQLNYLPQTVIDWLWANWLNINWNTLCECKPTSASGPCPPVDTPYRTFSGSRNEGYKLLDEVPAPHSWTTYQHEAWRTTDANPVALNISVVFANASHTVIGSPIGNQNLRPPSNGYDALAFGNIGFGASSADVRYIQTWCMPVTGTAGQNGTTYSYSIRTKTSFTGTCSDLPVPGPPFVPLPEPTQPDAPPMPPSPSTCTLEDLCQRLYAMAQVIQHISQVTTVHQRYGLPFAYVPGTLHTGLSAAGSFPIRNLVGVLVDITSPPPPRVLEGTPPYLWDQGWMSIMTGDGMIEERRITRDTQIWHPRLMQEATTFGYYFKAGVTATVRELWAEPY